jgi:hypothetical protein
MFSCSTVSLNAKRATQSHCIWLAAISNDWRCNILVYHIILIYLLVEIAARWNTNCTEILKILSWTLCCRKWPAPGSPWGRKKCTIVRACMELLPGCFSSQTDRCPPSPCCVRPMGPLCLLTADPHGQLVSQVSQLFFAFEVRPFFPIKKNIRSKLLVVLVILGIMQTVG